jgi:cytochrome c biogenesis factor
LILFATLISSLVVNIFSLMDYQKLLVRNLLNSGFFLMLCGISSAFLLLMYYQFQHTLQYAYVFNHTATGLPKIYLFSALWAGKEGVLLSWAMINAWIGFLLWRQFQVLHSLYKALGVFLLFNTILILICYLSHPFKLLPIAPSEGMGLAPALQNPWMLLHPPLVFLGYSSMAALFSLSLTIDCSMINSLIHLKKWTVMSSFFLGTGILTGSIWAEQALGWGKYWSWDPMENIALASWLILGVLAHSSPWLKKKRQSDYALPFVSAICGAFLVRSGILQNISLHAYGVSELTTWLSVLVVLTALLLVSWVFIVIKKQLLLPAQLRNNRKGILILIILSYVNILIIATILQVMGLIRTPKIFNFFAILFSLSCFSMLFLDRQGLSSKRINLQSFLAHGGFVLLFFGAILTIGFKPGVYLIWSGGLLMLLGDLLLLLKKEDASKYEQYQTY